MISGTSDSSPWGSSPSVVDDWLSAFDFGHLPPFPSTPADLSDLLNLDFAASFDISHSCLPDDDLNALSDGVSSIFNICPPPDQGCNSESGTPLSTNSSAVSSPHNSDSLSSVALEQDVFSALLETHLETTKENCGVFPENHGFAPENCNTHSSCASSRKRQRKGSNSDLDGSDMGNFDAKSQQQDPSDKKQQRVLRNRELAFESRQRKKCYVSDLETKCKMLEQERNQLQQQVCFFSAENTVLKEELSRMKKMKGGNGVTEPAVLVQDSLPLEFLLLLISLFLLLGPLSLCGNPSLALVLRTVLHPRSQIEAGELVKEPILSKMWSITGQFLHLPIRKMGLLIAWLARQVLPSQCFCNTSEGTNQLGQKKALGWGYDLFSKFKS